VTRTRAEEYRRLEQECRLATRSASTEELRAALLETARGWLRLAEEQDDEGAGLEGPVPPITTEHARQAIQQQQQVQPEGRQQEGIGRLRAGRSRRGSAGPLAAFFGWVITRARSPTTRECWPPL